MKKKEYLQPAMEIMKADTEAQILAGSVTELTTTGLGDGEELILPDLGLPGSDPFEFAW